VDRPPRHHPQYTGVLHPQYTGVLHREHAVVETAGVRTAKAMGLCESSPSAPTWPQKNAFLACWQRLSTWSASV
jgi:hypothetical protein